MGNRICDPEDFGLNRDDVHALHPVKVRQGDAVGEIPYDRMKPEGAFDQVSAEVLGGFERSQLQKFRDAYRAVWHVAHDL